MDVSVSILTVHGMRSALCRQWAEALEPMEIRHPNRESTVHLKLVDENPPRLTVYLDHTVDTVDGRTMENFQISTVTLPYFPGIKLAQTWMAAAWAGYLLHESLEMVTASGVRPIDPHRIVDGKHRLAPYQFDRGLRDGLPTVLTPETLLRTLCVVMDEDVAVRLVAELS